MDGWIDDGYMMDEWMDNVWMDDGWMDGWIALKVKYERRLSFMDGSCSEEIDTVTL